MLTRLTVVTILQYINICIYHHVKCQLHLKKTFEGQSEGVVKESFTWTFLWEVISR